MKSILQSILANLARRVLRKYKPVIVGITGSVGKTTTRTAVFTVLSKKYRVRTAEKNYNNEIGLPLMILGISYRGRNIVKWAADIARTYINLVLRTSAYPEVLVLEYGIDRPGDMDHLLSIARPNIAVVTAIGDVPAHIEFFKDPEDAANEKSKLVTALPADGFAILNHDDYAVYDMNEKIKAHVATFGFEEHAELRIVNYELRITKDAELGDVPAGIAFKLQQNGSTVPVRLNGFFGKPAAYATAAAAGVGLALGMNLVEISEALCPYQAPPGRMRLLRGIKNSFILDDTYNAAPEAMRSALDTLDTLPSTRKIAVLGDMLEIGRYTEQVHRTIGDKAAQFVDVLVTVGARAKFIADEALSGGVEHKQGHLSREKVLSFDDPVEAGRFLDRVIKPGDLILVKGSQYMRMEKVVEEIMAHPERASELLVRQEEYWKNTL